MELPFARLSDEDITLLGEYYADLANLPVGTPGRPRSLGPTAAAKTLYRLCPRTFLPWDDAIANTLHGARDAAAFMAHENLGRSWARRLLDESGLDERTLVASLGSEGRSLAKLPRHLAGRRGPSATPMAARRPVRGGDARSGAASATTG
ncbi:hypothetical protein [Streptomyces sp. uw30]|uniref:hypothetical protein n=1 Tax=Streptomyces sp. uw30 TaxID=1828179 RepID=UPI0011CDADC0|nr:hypothetical protein [Streptomyces sp. uw30]